MSHNTPEPFFNLVLIFYAAPERTTLAFIKFSRIARSSCQTNLG